MYCTTSLNNDCMWLVAVKPSDLLTNAALLQAFLLENVAEFKVPLLVTAQDKDQPGTENAAVRYTIVDGDPGGNFR